MPAVLIDSSNGSSSKIEVVSQTNDHSVVVAVIYFDSSYKTRIVLLGIITSKKNDLIFEDGAVVRNGSFFNYSVFGIVFLSGDEINPSVGPVGKEGIISIASVNG